MPKVLTVLSELDFGVDGLAGTELGWRAGGGAGRTGLRSCWAGGVLRLLTAFMFWELGWLVGLGWAGLGFAGLCWAGLGFLGLGQTIEKVF